MFFSFVNRSGNSDSHGLAARIARDAFLVDNSLLKFHFAFRNHRYTCLKFIKFLIFGKKKLFEAFDIDGASPTSSWKPFFAILWGSALSIN